MLLRHLGLVAEVVRGRQAAARPRIFAELFEQNAAVHQGSDRKPEGAFQRLVLLDNHAFAAVGVPHMTAKLDPGAVACLPETAAAVRAGKDRQLAVVFAVDLRVAVSDDYFAAPSLSALALPVTRFISAGAISSSGSTQSAAPPAIALSGIPA